MTLIVAIGSAIFSIRRVDAYCFNADDTELNEAIVADKDKLMGKSIFTLDESKLIAEIEERVGGIKIVNVERLFPNRVSINYVKLYDYFEVLYDGKYYISAIDGKFNRVQDFSQGDKIIEIRINLTEPPALGSELTSAEHYDALSSMINMLERLNFRDSDASSIIEFIDLKVSDSNIYVMTRGGTLLKLMKFDSAGSKLRKALSLYASDEKYRHGGMITVTNSDVFTFTENADKIYEESNL